MISGQSVGSISDAVVSVVCPIYVEVTFQIQVVFLKSVLKNWAMAQKQKIRPTE